MIWATCTVPHPSTFPETRQPSPELLPAHCTLLTICHQPTSAHRNRTRPSASWGVSRLLTAFQRILHSVLLLSYESFAPHGRQICISSQLNQFPRIVPRNAHTFWNTICGSHCILWGSRFGELIAASSQMLGRIFCLLSHRYYEPRLPRQNQARDHSLVRRVVLGARDQETTLGRP
jgi:hypothetical protein